MGIDYFEIRLASDKSGVLIKTCNVARTCVFDDIKNLTLQQILQQNVDIRTELLKKDFLEHCGLERIPSDVNIVYLLKVPSVAAYGNFQATVSTSKALRFISITLMENYEKLIAYDKTFEVPAYLKSFPHECLEFQNFMIGKFTELYIKYSGKV